MSTRQHHDQGENKVTSIEKYESEQESAEREAWYGLSMQTLARAYGEDEPEYTTDMLRWVNPDYEGK